MMALSNKSILTTVVSLFVCLAASSVAQAQLVDVAQCRKITDAQKRFSCYEALETVENSALSEAHAPAPGNINAPELSVSPAAEQPPVAVSEKNVKIEPAASDSPEDQAAVADFGSRQYRARLSEDDDGREALVDTVADIRRIRNTQLEITLSSGQVWRQMISKRFDLRKGDEVSITPLRMGEYYRLTSQRSPGYIQVGRVR